MRYFRSRDVGLGKAPEKQLAVVFARPSDHGDPAGGVVEAVLNNTGVVESDHEAVSGWLRLKTLGQGADEPAQHRVRQQ